jgi:hypothetical protein
MDYSYREYLKGWVPLIDPLVAKVESINEKFPLGDVKVVQIKEKFGGLRFYFHTSYEQDRDEPEHELWLDEVAKLNQMIDEASEASFSACNDCCKPGKQHTIRGWYATLCEACADDYKSGRKR